MEWKQFGTSTLKPEALFMIIVCMIFYIRGKKKKKISVRIFGLSRNPTHPYVKTNSLYQTTKIVGAWK